MILEALHSEPRQDIGRSIWRLNSDNARYRPAHVAERATRLGSEAKVRILARRVPRRCPAREIENWAQHLEGRREAGKILCLSLTKIKRRGSRAILRIESQAARRYKFLVSDLLHIDHSVPMVRAFIVDYHRKRYRLVQ